MSQSTHNEPIAVREGEGLDIEQLNKYLKGKIPDWQGELQLSQFPSGYSNLTYMLNAGEKEYVLRRPPFGANIKSAHDMKREFDMLAAIKSAYTKVPNSIIYCGDENIIGAEFYLMERVNGLILRQKPPKDVKLTPEVMLGLSTALIDNLVEIHQIDISKSQLEEKGKPTGYISRQVTGWIKRYSKAATEEIKDMEFLAEWMPSNMPAEGKPSLIHNDYKYDNIIFDLENIPNISAVLDWEMATIGEPLMDLGTTLAYWADEDSHPALKSFSLTALSGNLTRQQLAERYMQKSGNSSTNMVFFYVYASYKIAVICQQIYARYKKGLTKDQRFAQLIYLVKACAQNAMLAIKYDRIGNFR